MDGNLLLAVDVLYKQWENADLWKVLYDNQWVFQFGAQYTMNERMKLRCGYVYAEDAMASDVGGLAGGVAPAGGRNAIQYVQALFGNFMEHRMTLGVGIEDVIPGLDIDVLAGGMFEDSMQFGFTGSTVSSYWIGMGMTWHFDGAAAGRTECDACDECDARL